MSVFVVVEIEIHDPIAYKEYKLRDARVSACSPGQTLVGLTGICGSR